MGRPKGSKNIKNKKVKSTDTLVVETNDGTLGSFSQMKAEFDPKEINSEEEKKADVLIKKKQVEVESPKFYDKPAASDRERIAESRKALAFVLPPEQQFFEAPDGMIIVGDSDRPHVFYRQGNGGEGCFINPMRK